LSKILHDLLKILVLCAFCYIQGYILTTKTRKSPKLTYFFSVHQINNEWSMTVPQINGTFGVYSVIKYLILLLKKAINSMWCASWRFLFGVDFYRLWIVYDCPILMKIRVQAMALYWNWWSCGVKSRIIDGEIYFVGFLCLSWHT